MDFLFHEMAIATFVDHARAGRNNHRFTVCRGAIAEENINSISADKCIVMVFEIKNLARQMRKCSGIRPDIGAIVAKTYGQGGRISRDHNDIGTIFYDSGKSISPFDFRQNLLHSLIGIQTSIKRLDK